MLITKSPPIQPPVTLINLTASQVPFTIRGASGQSTDLQRWTDSTPTTLAWVDSSGGIHTTNNLYTGTNALLQVAGGTLGINSQNGTTFGNGLFGTGTVPVKIQSHATTTVDIQQWLLGASTVGASIDKMGRITFPNVEAITASAGAAAGTSPPAPVPTGNDVRGQVTFGTGTGPTAGIMAHVTFTTAFASVPYISLTALNAATAALQIYPTNPTTTGFDIACGVAPAASQANTVYAALFNALG